MKRPALIGLLIWAGATLALRVAGQYLLRGPAIVLLAVSLPAMVAVAIAVVGRYRVPAERAIAAIALVAPGMLLDTVSTIWFARIFPNMRGDAAGLFGGWLLFCNVIVLLTAVFYAPRNASRV